MSGEGNIGPTGYNSLGGVALPPRRTLDFTSQDEYWRPTAGPLSATRAFNYLSIVKFNKEDPLTNSYPRFPYPSERTDIEPALDALRNYYQPLYHAEQYERHPKLAYSRHEFDAVRRSAIRNVEEAMEHDEIGNLFAVPDDNPELQRHRDIFVNWLQDVLASPK